MTSEFVPPMKAVARERAPRGDEWVYELKWDGMRVQLHLDPDGLRLYRSTRGRPGRGFPELEPLVDAVSLPVVLDGEVVVFDGPRPSFGRLQNRMHVERPTVDLVGEHPVHFLAFDVLEVDARPTLDLPWRDRRRLLEQVLDQGPSWRVPAVGDDPDELWRLVEAHELEGLVAKRRGSPYRPGARSADWVKVKLRRRQELVVVGWLEGSGSLQGTIGSLVVAYRDGDRWALAGSVGSGLDERSRSLLQRRLRPADGSPFTEATPLDRLARWVRPDTVVEVGYGEWQPPNLLRHPTFHGLREDLDPLAVTREITRPVESDE